MRADGAGTGGAGEPYPAARLRSMLFPSDWDTAPQEFLPRLIPDGVPVLWNDGLFRGPRCPRKSTPQASVWFLLKPGNSQDVPCSHDLVGGMTWPGFLSAQLLRLGDLRKPSHPFLSPETGSTGVCWERSEKQGVRMSWKGAHANVGGGDPCRGHLQVPAEDWGPCRRGSLVWYSSRACRREDSN